MSVSRLMLGGPMHGELIATPDGRDVSVYELPDHPLFITDEGVYPPMPQTRSYRAHRLTAYSEDRGYQSLPVLVYEDVERIDWS